MPMVTLTLPCGCKPVVYYRSRVPWDALAKNERAKIVREGASDHVCRRLKPESQAPVLSDQPQKP